MYLLIFYKNLDDSCGWFYFDILLFVLVNSIVVLGKENDVNAIVFRTKDNIIIISEVIDRFTRLLKSLDELMIYINQVCPESCIETFFVIL